MGQAIGSAPGDQRLVRPFARVRCLGQRAVEVRVRRYQPSDREAAVLLAPRLQTGVAGWRDQDAVLKAVAGWIESSLANADAQDREVFVADAGGEIIGLGCCRRMSWISPRTDAP